MEIEVRGAEKLAQLGKALKELGDKELRKETLRSLREAAKPLGEKPKRRALAVLPASGGLASYVAGSRVSVRTRMSGRNVGVRLVGVRNKAGGRVDLNAIDRGRVRHKTFGHRPWVNQSVTAGWWSDALQEGAGEARAAVEAAVGAALERAAGAR